MNHEELNNHVPTGEMSYNGLTYNIDGKHYARCSGEIAEGPTVSKAIANVLRKLADNQDGFDSRMECKVCPAYFYDIPEGKNNYLIHIQKHKEFSENE